MKVSFFPHNKGRNQVIFYAIEKSTFKFAVYFDLIFTLFFKKKSLIGQILLAVRSIIEMIFVKG